MREQPCKRDCPRRSATCSSTCKDWKDYVVDRNAGYEERKRKADFHQCKQVVLDRANHNLWLKRRK